MTATMNYKLEELKFLNMKKESVYVSNPYMKNGLTVFAIEKTLTEEEKLQFIDEMKDGVGTYLFNIFKKWEEEKDSLKQDEFGNVKTVSKKAWIKRNDNKEMINNSFDLGRYWLFGTEFKTMSTTCPEKQYGHGMEYTGKSVIHQWFHDLCKELCRNERKYFQEHDPKEIKLATVKEYGKRYDIYFDNMDLHDILYNSKTDVSEEFLDTCIEAFKELEKSVQHIALKFNK